MGVLDNLAAIRNLYSEGDGVVVVDNDVVDLCDVVEAQGRVIEAARLARLAYPLRDDGPQSDIDWYMRKLDEALDALAAGGTDGCEPLERAEIERLREALQRIAEMDTPIPTDDPRTVGYFNAGSCAEVARAALASGGETETP